MKSESGIHVLARAVIVEDNKLLVTTDVKRNVSFLPGGHIHYGEKAHDCLKRELLEELGESFEINSLLGVIEDAWDFNGQLYHGVHLIFKATPLQTGLIQGLKPNESELALEWVNIHELSTITNLFPKLLAVKIPQWVKSAGMDFGSEWLA
jgi:8-oxo-dGTP pyrophosphatase MutT (NUDIX family)